MTSMFSGCKFLTEINLSSFNTQNKVKINDMFLDCSSLKNIDKCKDKKILEEFKRTKEKWSIKIAVGIIIILKILKINNWIKKIIKRLINILIN